MKAFWYRYDLNMLVGTLQPHRMVCACAECHQLRKDQLYQQSSVAVSKAGGIASLPLCCLALIQ